MPPIQKHKNNHYDLLLQNNSTKAIYHIDGENESESVLFVKLTNFDFTREYEIINDGSTEVMKGIIHSGEYSYALFWNTLGIEFDASNPTNDLLKVKIKIPYDNGTVLSVELKDLHPDVGLARIENPNDPEDMRIYEKKEDFTQLNNENLYYSLD